MKSHCLDPQLLSDYALLHYNYKYDWLRPKLEEIVAAYMRLYGAGKESRDSDNESDGSDGTGGLEEEDGDVLWHVGSCFSAACDASSRLGHSNECCIYVL